MNCACLCFLLTSIPIACDSLLIDFNFFKIGAFEVQLFLDETPPDKLALDTLIKIVRHYDILFMQDTTSTTMAGMELLLEEVNKGDYEYAISSSRQCNETFKTGQHAFFYRTLYISVLACSLYNATGTVFESPPFTVTFKSARTELSEFTLIGVHISPTNTYNELTALVNVHAAVREEFATEDVIILGNLQADCDYLAPYQLHSLDIRQSRFHWLIVDDMDTSIEESVCAYDRIIVSGQKMIASIVKHSAGVMRFDMEYSITRRQARSISRNYPIEVFLEKDKSNSQQSANEKRPMSMGAVSNGQKTEEALNKPDNTKSEQYNEDKITLNTDAHSMGHGQFTDQEKVDTSQRQTVTRTIANNVDDAAGQVIRETQSVPHSVKPETRSQVTDREEIVTARKDALNNKQDHLVTSDASTHEAEDLPSGVDANGSGYSNLMESNNGHSAQDAVFVPLDNDENDPKRNSACSFAAQSLLQVLIKWLTCVFR